MPLVKSRTLTPALLAAKRRNAQKSTGPRTARGKAYSRVNGLRHGGRSPAYRQLWMALGNARPGAIGRTAQALLPQELARHPLFAEIVDLFRWAEMTLAGQRPILPGERAPKVNMSRTIRGNAVQPHRPSARWNEVAGPTVIAPAGQSMNNDDRSLYVDENKQNIDKMTPHNSDIFG